MIEKVEKLETDSENTAFPVGNVCVFHNGKVCRDVARSAKTVTALRKCHARTAAGTIRTRQIPSVESCLATCLHKQSARIRRAIREHLRREAGNRGRRNNRPLAAGSRRAE